LLILLRVKFRLNSGPCSLASYRNPTKPLPAQHIKRQIYARNLPRSIARDDCADAGRREPSAESLQKVVVQSPLSSFVTIPKIAIVFNP